MEMENLDFKLNVSNPFEAVGSLMSTLASDRGQSNSSRQFYDRVIVAHDLDPIAVRERATTLIRECERILQLRFLPEHESAVESHWIFLLTIREAFYALALSSESNNPHAHFKTTWDDVRWSILSLSVKSFRSQYQNYELIELVKRYLTVLRQLLTESEESESVTEALELLTDILNSLDEELWKSSWEEYTARFAILDGLLRTESKENPDSPLSNFYTATREAVWKVVYHTNRVADAVLFVPKAYAALNIGLALCSDALPAESVQVVKNFIELMPHLPLPDAEMSAASLERDALPEASTASLIE